MDGAPAIRREGAPGARRALVRWCVQSALGLVGYGVVLFLPAGRLDWLWGWVMLGLTGACLIAQPAILIWLNPDLLVERGKGLHAEGTRTWDRVVVAVSVGVGMMGAWVVAGLDLRFGWSAGMSTGLHVLGVALMALGYALFLWAMACNAFFSEAVRIQTERGHSVATGGPYRVVRHPGYAGAIVGFVGTPLVLGSCWALIPAMLGVCGYVVRTALEDRTLQAELPGYGEYAQQTRYRLLPGIW